MQKCYGCMKDYDKKFDICPYCGYVPNSLPKIKNHLAPGTILANRYVLGKVLGYGGFGITYIAWDETLSRTVAIKEFFANSLASRNEGETEVYCYDRKAAVFFEEGKNKMIDEGKRLSKFSGNPNIVNVFDCFKENNTAYIVMEHLVGKDLNKHLSDNFGGISPEEAVRIILPVLNALDDMHKEKMIHRDVSPDNIFLCDNGTIKLLDFGSARLAVEDSDKSLSIMLKRGYAPREQYMSRSKQGPWTDIYAVCATLYHIITGKKPAESTERDEIPLKSFAEMGVKGYDELEKAVFKGMELEIGNRIQNVGELKVMLEKSVRKAPKYDPPPKLSIPEIPEPPKKTPKKLNPKIRNYIIIAASVAVIIAVAVAAVKFLPEKKADGDETTLGTEQPLSNNITAVSEISIPESHVTASFNIVSTTKEVLTTIKETLVSETTSETEMQTESINLDECRTEEKSVDTKLKYGVTRHQVFTTYYHMQDDGSEIVVKEELTSETFDKTYYYASNDDLLSAANENKNIYSKEISSVLEIINSYREEARLNPLYLQEDLVIIACMRAEELAWSGVHKNTRPNYKIGTSLLNENGYSKGLAGESIAWGFTDPNDVCEAWKSTEPNYENIINPKFSKIGIGVAADPDKKLELCWTVYFLEK